MKFKAFVVRLWRDPQGGLLGQISDPHGGERLPFRDSAELWRYLQSNLALDPPPQPSLKGDPHDDQST